MSTTREVLPRMGGEIAASELLERARKLGPLVEQQVQRRFDEAGFYRMLRPKRYGGIETDLPTSVQR